MSIINTIKSNLRTSVEAHMGLIKLRSYGRDDYELNASLMEAFLVLNNYDKQIENTLLRLVNSREETEVHNVIAGLSYELPSYGIKTKHLYYMDKALIALSTFIVEEYINIVGSREELNSYVSNGVKRFTTDRYISATDYEAVEKNMLEGIHFEKGKVLNKYIKTKPGAPKLRLNSVLKKVAKGVASMPMKVVSDISKEDILALLLDGEDYTQAKSSNKDVKEHHIAMKARFERYSELYEMIQTRSNLAPIYHSVNFCYRNRMYYDISLMVLNPQSKIGKYVYERAHARKLGERDYKELCFAVVSTVQRTELDSGVELFELEEEAFRSKLMEETDFLKLTYNKRLLQAIDTYRLGGKSRFLIAKDFTTGGLIHFASGYTQEKKSMLLGNIVEGSSLYDTHSIVANAVGVITGRDISRGDAKVINQSILAGASIKSAAKKFNEYFNEEVVTENSLTEAVIEVYGKTAVAFNQYNTWGKKLLDNENSSLMWTMLDGCKAMSSAYIKGQEVMNFVPTSKGMKKVTVHRNMPLIIENTSSTPLVIGDYAQAKVSGFLANVTHSVDAYVLRRIVLAMLEEHEVGLFIHDNIMTSGMCHNAIVLPEAKEVIKENFDNKVFLDIQKQVVDNRIGNKAQVIDYSVNDMTSLCVSDSFMQA